MNGTLPSEIYALKLSDVPRNTHGGNAQESLVWTAAVPSKLQHQLRLDITTTIGPQSASETSPRPLAILGALTAMLSCTRKLLEARAKHGIPTARKQWDAVLRRGYAEDAHGSGRPYRQENIGAIREYRQEGTGVIRKYGGKEKRKDIGQKPLVRRVNSPVDPIFERSLSLDPHDSTTHSKDAEPKTKKRLPGIGKSKPPFPRKTRWGTRKLEKDALFGVDFPLRGGVVGGIPVTCFTKFAIARKQYLPGVVNEKSMGITWAVSKQKQQAQSISIWIWRRISSHHHTAVGALAWLCTFPRFH